MAAVEALDDLFVLWDEDDRLVICNDRHRELFPYLPPLEQLRGRRFEDLPGQEVHGLVALAEVLLEGHAAIDHDGLAPAKAADALLETLEHGWQAGAAGTGARRARGCRQARGRHHLGGVDRA